MYPPKHFIVLLLCAIGFQLASQQIEKLPTTVNSPDYHEFAPALGFDHQVLFFTREAYPEFEKTFIHGLEDASASMDEADYDAFLTGIYNRLSGEKVDKPASSSFNQDIWMAIMEAGQVTEVKHPGFPLNNAMPNSVEAVLYNPTRIVQPNEFYKIGGMGNGISWLEMDDEGFFKFPVPVMVANFYNRSNQMSFSMNGDGSTIVFSLERDKKIGSSDLYIAHRIRDRIYNEPQLLPSPVNSTAKETSPFITESGDRIYFASDRDGSSSLDLYFTDKLPGRSGWSDPVLVSGAINSGSNESHPYIDEQSGYLYFSSDRDGTYDIYRYKLESAGSLESPIIVDGVVLNSAGEPVSANIHYGSQALLGPMELFRSNSGEFRIELTKDVPVVFYAETGVAQSIRKEVIPSFADEGVIRIELTLEENPVTAVADVEDPEEKGLIPGVGEKRILDKIYFERSTDVIRSESDQQLKALYRELKDKPQVNILLVGHTDNQGNKEQLVGLSIQRANAVKKYLVRLGIDTDRIKIQGLGPDQPVASNKTETERALNRRVEIMVID